jgi:MFS transporter, Spinster family, sphingosine-1-phosphate transporter
MRQAFYKHYLLGLLLVILAFNWVDRIALGLVLEDIKADLTLSDTQLGLMTGIAFALFYSLMGIPIARWADRGNRVTIISLTALLWSVTVAACGMATSFVQLLLIRIGVGVGEAGCVPPAHSLLADYYSRAERPRAVGIYMQGPQVSLVIGYFLAGWLNELYGWRMTFILLGLPGLLLAALAQFTLREPRRQMAAPVTLPETQPSLKEVFVTLWVNSTFRHLLYGISVFYFFGYGILQWQPAFFVRSFGLNTGELGTWFALVLGICGILGTQLGSEWASRRAAGNESRQLRMAAYTNVGFNGLLWALVYLTDNSYMAFVLMGLSTIGGTMLFGPLFAALQTLVPPRMRAMSIALIYLFANLIGMGLGPLAVGILSDALHPLLGGESLRYALLILCPGYLWVSWHFWRASQTVTRDIELVQTTVSDEGSGGEQDAVRPKQSRGIYSEPAATTLSSSSLDAQIRSD